MSSDEAQQPETQPPCSCCKGDGGDPDDQGDWIPEAGMYQPTVPCPECHGSGLQATGGAQQPATQAEDLARIDRLQFLEEEKMSK